MVKKRKKTIKSVHVKAVLLTIAYFAAGSAIIAIFSGHTNWFLAFGLPMAFGAVMGVVFLYLFSHEEFFPFIKEIEKKKMAKEKKWLKRFARFGKITTSFLVGIIGGPLFGALTTRLLLNRYKHKYILVVVANIPSTFLTMGIVRGFITIWT